jgi:phage-related protein
VAITVGSVEVDVIPNTQGIYQRLRAGIVPAATRAGEDAGSAAGRAFGPAMQGQVNSVGLRIGEEIGQQIASRITASLRDAIRSGVTTGGQTARPAATRQGDETGGAFSRALKARLEAAFRSLPRADIRIGDAGFDTDMARLRARIETLSGKRIGIDVTAEAAKAEITAIEERLRRLGAEHPNVQVRADTAAALAQLAAVRAQIDGVDGDTAHARVDIDTSGAMSAIFQLTVALAGVAAIPAIPVLGAGLGALASSAVAAGAGVGALAAVAIPAISGIRAALTAQTAAQQAASTANASAGQSSSQAASKALQLAGAQQSLATAERNGANQIAQAQQQVKQARQGVSDAIAQAAQRTQQAERQVQDAERALTQAQKDATQAQLDLTAARKQAVRDLQDMNNNLADAQLSQRDAMLQVQEAKTSLDATLANPKATELQRQQAQLQYDQAVQHLKEQQLQTKRLQSDTAAANKAGVNGSASVKTAQDKVAAAQQTVADRTRALRDAQVNQAQVATQNARAIADAQQKVATAEKNVATAQQNAADSIASAQRQIQQAQLSTASTASKAETAQSKYQAALAKLTPAARGTFDAFLALRAAFKSWSESLQPQVMPLFTRALVSLRNTLPTLTLFVKGAVDAIKELQDRVSASVKSPFWQGFKKDLQGSVKPAIVGLGVAFGNVITGMAGIIDAFLPHMDGISGGLQRITGKFADWGTSLKGSPAFERFLQYAAQEAPKLGAALGQIATAFLAVGTAIAPLSGPALAIITALASGIASLATTMPGLVQLMYATYVATRLVTIAQFAYNTALGVYRAGVVLATLLTEGWAAAIVAANLAFDANPIVVVVGIIVAVLAALVLAVIYAWNHFTWFRDAVKAVWTAIQIAALWAWQNVLQPVFNAIWGALKSVGDKAVWLWRNVLVPAFSAIALAARILITAILVILILPWVLAFKLVATVATWLWAHAIKPAFDAIGAAAGWLWRNAISPSLHGIADLAHWLYNTAIRPVGSVIQTALHAVGNAGTWLWRNAISPAVHGISDAAHWLYDKAIKPVFGAISTVIDGTWRNGIKPVFDLLKTAVGKVADSFETARKTIKTAWDKLEDIAKKPVNFIIDVVYNKGIVGVWNKIAGAFGAPTLKTFQFATGGIMPGYTPGRDVHQFVSPTGGALELSGGEAIMRPEFTRAVGSGFVGAMNSIAKSRGEQGVKAALAPVFGGNPSTPTDRSLKYADGGLVQRFGDGGIFGWISSAASAVKGVGSAAWNGIKKGASWLADTLEASARAGVKHVVDPLLSQFPGMDTGFGKMIRHIPTHMIDALFGYSKESDKKGGGGLGGPKIQSALNWAKTQAGLPYQWAGNGNPSWDCSGFMSAIESVIRGQKPHRRWATGAFSGETAPPGWVLHGNSPFRIGITNAGVGHTAGTLGKTNVESRGGAGVIVGSRARGYKDSLFTDWYGFQPGKYDSGGYLQPGMNLAFNGTGRPEPVFTSAQAKALTSMAAHGTSGPASFEGDLYLDSGEFLGKVRGEAQQVMQQGQRDLMSVINAS